MGLGNRRAARHQTAASEREAAFSEIHWDFRPEQRVMTVDGFPGKVAEVLDGPHPGNEEYRVVLDNGMGGGRYTASQLQALTHSEASTAHTAADDYPELGSVLADRPDIAHNTVLGSLTASWDDEGDLSSKQGALLPQDHGEHGPWNGHGQCKQCGYTPPTEGDEPCDHPYCEGFPEGWHTKAEHMDPPHLDPGSREYHDAQRAVGDAFGGNAEDADWLLGQQHQGPTHLSSKQGEVDPYAMLVVAAIDPDFRFHVTAAWADVRNKAKRIRSEGGVRITSVSEGMVIGEVKGDTNVYETGIQRMPGRQAVATYSCGCKWGAYHWGADDDFSRFAGRMCSHALALNYEAQSRGMFGRDVTEDSGKSSWTPRKVVVKYDIDGGQNRLAPATASKQEPLDCSPLSMLITGALMAGENPAELTLALKSAGIERSAAVSSPFGEPSQSPQPPAPNGATSPRRPGENPSSAGFASGADPDNWGEISPSSMYSTTPTLASARSQGSLDDLDEAMFEPVSRTAAKDEEPEQPTHAGLALKAADTGRILMLQRSLEDSEDPAAGTWEFPGGGREPGDKHSLDSAIREWEEEVGQSFPEGGHVSHVWRSGPYQGHVVVIPNENQVALHNGRVTVNPDDPDGEAAEQAAWWDPEHARKNPALREECKDSPWGEIRKAATVHTANPLALAVPLLRAVAPTVVRSLVPDALHKLDQMGRQEPEDDEDQQYEAMLHDEPEGALPTTDGAEDEVAEGRFASLDVAFDHKQKSYTPPTGRPCIHCGSPATNWSGYGWTGTGFGWWGPACGVHTPGATGEAPSPQVDSSALAGASDFDAGDSADGMSAIGSVDRIVAEFQRNASHLVGGGGAPGGNSDIAAAAKAFLETGQAPEGMAKQALKDFTPAEQQTLINEGLEVRAGNLDRLQIEGTHYEALDAALAAQVDDDDDEESWTV